MKIVLGSLGIITDLKICGKSFPMTMDIKYSNHASLDSGWDGKGVVTGKNLYARLVPTPVNINNAKHRKTTTCEVDHK